MYSMYFVFSYFICPLYCSIDTNACQYVRIKKLLLYGIPLWRYNNHYNIERFSLSWRKAIRRLWKIPYITHNALVHHINICNSIVSILEKRCVKFLWNLLNSDNVLFGRICKYSVYNSDTTMGENMRYFMYKYNLMYDD